MKLYKLLSVKNPKEILYSKKLSREKLANFAILGFFAKVRLAKSSENCHSRKFILRISCHFSIRQSLSSKFFLLFSTPQLPNLRSFLKSVIWRGRKGHIFLKNLIQQLVKWKTQISTKTETKQDVSTTVETNLDAVSQLDQEQLDSFRSQRRNDEDHKDKEETWEPEDHRTNAFDVFDNFDDEPSL